MNLLEDQIRQLQRGVLTRNIIIGVLVVIAIALFLTTLNEMNALTNLMGI